MLKIPAQSLLAGLASALLYLLVVHLGLGFLFLFLPTLPIFWFGLKGHTDEALHAVLLATLLLSVLSHPWVALFLYFSLLGMPAWYMSRETMQYGQGGGLKIWFPMTAIFAQLMALFSLLLLLASLYDRVYASGMTGFFAPILEGAVAELSRHMDAPSRQQLQEIAPKLAFLVLAVSAWIWSGCLYLHAWVTHRELCRQQLPTRPDLAIMAFPPPNWMISLLLLATLAALIGSPALAFWGKASMMMLLLPYFLFGMSLLHLYSRKFSNRLLLLTICYAALALLLWPILLVAMVGMLYHLQLLNKYLSSGGTSSRS